MQLPDHGQGQHEHGHVGQDVGHRDIAEKCQHVDAGAAPDGLVPRERDGVALEHVREEDGGAPGDDEGYDRVDGQLEPRVGKDADVEEQEDEFGEGDGEAVE